MTDTTPTLKPCPFCGRPAEYTEHEKTCSARVWCASCGAEGPLGGLSDRPGAPDAAARAGWNTRPIEDALRTRAEAAESALATARAEGAAAERAAIVAMLRVDLGDLENVNDAADDFVRDLIEDIEGGVHVRPVEGA